PGHDQLARDRAPSERARGRVQQVEPDLVAVDQHAIEIPEHRAHQWSGSQVDGGGPRRRSLCSLVRFVFPPRVAQRRWPASPIASWTKTSSVAGSGKSIDVPLQVALTALRPTRTELHGSRSLPSPR